MTEKPPVLTLKRRAALLAANRTDVARLRLTWEAEQLGPWPPREERPRRQRRALPRPGEVDEDAAVAALVELSSQQLDITALLDDHARTIEQLGDDQLGDQ